MALAWSKIARQNTSALQATRPVNCPVDGDATNCK